MRNPFKLLILISIALTNTISMSQNPVSSLPSNSSWQSKFPHQVVYQIFTRSFADGNGNGMGDINGIRNKLSYLSDLGIGAIWLTPIFASPTYHKYDITDYYLLDKDCGTQSELKKLVEEAHALNIKVILDFVANHTSSDHEWFKASIKGQKPYRDYYYWSSDPGEWEKDPEHWHWVDDRLKGTEKYYGFFWRGMPDLNYDNQEVHSKIIDAALFWIKECNIDGYRLDAASHIYPYKDRKKNHEWWKEFSEAMRKVKPDFYLVGEMWGGDTLIAPYLKAGFNAGFNFDLWFNIKASLEQEKDLVTIKLLDTYKNYTSNNRSFCDATILSNHDNPRIMDEVKGNTGKAKQAAAILFTLPYTPYVYYGDELGMFGPKPDEHIREPFLWQQNDAAYCRWEPNFHNATTPTLPVQLLDSNSIYHAYKKLIHCRNNDQILSEGNFKLAPQSKTGFLIYVRELKTEKYLVIHNLSGVESQIDLKTFSISEPIELIYEFNGKAVLKEKMVSIPSYGSVVMKF